MCLRKVNITAMYLCWLGKTGKKSKLYYHYYYYNI